MPPVPSVPRRPRVLRLALAALGLASVLAGAAAAGTDAPLPVLGSEGAAPSAPRDTGLPLIRTYGVRDYHEYAQNWVATQDADGLLCVGNNNGVVLTYDGHEWRSIRVAQPGAPVRGLEFDAAGRLWVGATGAIGYLEKDGRGGFTYTSLLDRLPEDVRANIVMYYTVVRPDGVFFFTYRHVLRWDGAKFDVEKLQRSSPLRVGSRLLRHSAGRPLEEWRDGAWRVLADLPELRRQVVRFATTRADGSLLLGTEHDGFFVLKDGALMPWRTECDAFLKSAGIDRGLQLRDGAMVLGHRPQGFSILESDGRLRHFFSAENSSLPTSIAWSFLEDRDDNLWVMLDSGLALIGRDEGVTYFGQGSMRQLNASSIAPFRGSLFLATATGPLRLEPGAPGETPPREARLVPVPGISGDVRSLYPAGNEFLLATVRGLLVWDGGLTAPTPLLAGKHVSRLWVSPLDPRHALAGTLEGAIPLERGPQGWRAGDPLPGIDAEIRAFAPDADGALWLSTNTRGLYRVVGLPGTASADGRPLRIDAYAGGNGLPVEHLGSALTIAVFQGRTHFLVENRVYRFDAAARRFVEAFSPGERVGLPGAEVITFDADQAGNLWIALRAPEDGGWPARARLYFEFRPDGAVQAVPFRVSDYLGANVFVQSTREPGAGETAWMVGTDGIVRFADPAHLPESRSFHVRISRVLDAKGAALPLTQAVRLPYARRSLTLLAAADRFGDAYVRYQTRLDDEPWSEWSDQPRQGFERLPIGRHVLQVRARDADGVIAAPATFAVRVLSPWWLAWWALGLYGAGAATAVFAVLRWRLRAVRRRNAELEHLVAARTAELEANQDQLGHALAAAEDANRAKSVFLASMSHELRTPLNAILGYAQILQRTPGLGAEPRRQLETIHASGDHLLQLINDVLDLAKIEAGKVELLPQAFSLSRLLAHLTEVFEPRAAQKRIAFSLHGETPLPDVVTGDEGRLRQVLFNLLGNAIKFTERGRVELRVSAADGRVRFSVVDTGIGIAAAEQQAIFGLFHQAAGPALSAQGSGLGLAISQRLVRLMGGEITVESAPGAGSRFSFELPLSTVEESPASAVAERTPAGYRGARRRVLIVDDEPVNRDILRTLLAPLGFEIEETDDGLAAVERVAAHPPDLVLMDVRLKRLDGLTATRRIRALPGGAAVRIVAISASVFPVDRTQAVEAGCDDFEPKPIRAAALLATIGRVLGLEWEWSAGYAAGTRPPDALPDALPDAWTLPTLATIETLNGHAELGDLAALREALAAARVTAPDAVAFLDALETFAAHAELPRLRAWLARALARASLSAS